jgi:hypothetical protein
MFIDSFFYVRDLTIFFMQLYNMHSHQLDIEHFQTETVYRATSLTHFADRDSLSRKEDVGFHCASI